MYNACHYVHIVVILCTLWWYLYVGDGQVFIEGPAVDRVCYGNTISLLCSYPNIMDMVNSTVFKYISPSGEWAVNGAIIPVADIASSVQPVNSTAERLDITLTREQFGNGVFYYSCYLVLYNGSRETSSEVEIDPPGEGVYLCDIDCVWSIATSKPVVCRPLYNHVLL